MTPGISTCLGLLVVLSVISPPLVVMGDQLSCVCLSDPFYHNCAVCSAFFREGIKNMMDDIIDFLIPHRVQIGRVNYEPLFGREESPAMVG